MFNEKNYKGVYVMTTEQKKFIDKVASTTKKYSPRYGIKIISPIIAQSILESNWGKSQLASKYHNYFGMKCGSSWNGKSVNLKTNEEFIPGTITNITSNFRVYDSFDEGIKGYFEFINKPRYANLKGITDPMKYLETIKSDGYATSDTYVTKNMKIITEYNLTRYDSKKTPNEIAEEIVKYNNWGTGDERKKLLEQAGYDYDEIQSEVNKLLRK